MKRWVWLGLVGGLVACAEEKPPSQVEPQACPGTTEESLPGSVQAQALAESDDGLEDVLITFRPRVSANAMARADAFATDVERTGGQVKRRFPHLNLVSARLTPQAREALARNPDVVSVEPNHEVHAFGMPRLAPSAWLGGTPNTVGSVGEYTEGLKMIQAPAVWDANNDGVLDTGSASGTNIKVCVIDSGWDDRHPELKAAYVGGMDFVEREDKLPAGTLGDGPLDRTLKDGVYVYGGGHGTHTAATIAAQFGAGGKVRPKQDANGVVGVAPTVQLLVARVLDVSGSGKVDDVIAAVDWCKSQGAKIASLSLGSNTDNETEKATFERALAGGMLAFAATGNSGAPKVAFPAAYESVVAVGAVDFTGEWQKFSQYGAEVSLVGPGVDVLSATIVGASPFSAVAAAGAQFKSNPLSYSAISTYSGRLVNCGQGESVAACGEEATCDGFVAYVDRGGGLYFEEKARNAIQAGAKAVIVGNNNAAEEEGAFTLGGPSAIWVPTTSVSLESGAALKRLVGQQVTVDVSGTDYLVQTGTSMATPHVAGAAALLWSALPHLTPLQVREALEKSAKPLGPEGRDAQYGFGLVQAADAIEYANTHFPVTAP